MAKAEFYAAGYMLIKNNEGKYLFMRRANTGFRDGAFQIPAGHIEGMESIIDCTIREAKEEININILENDCKVVHISHRIDPYRVYFDCYINIKKYHGELKINEPEKCSELKWVDIYNIPNDEKKLFSYDLDIIKMIEKGICISEIKPGK